MFNVGGLEFAVIAIVALLVFGPKRLPEVSRQVGTALRELRRVQTQVKSEIDDAFRLDDMPTKPNRAALQSRPVPRPGRPDTDPPPVSDELPAETPLDRPEATGAPDSSFD
jgi:Tat protein translocase TatB subunit